MTDEKMIEEMAQCMANCEITCDECFEQVESVMTMKIKQRENHCQAYKFAKTLFSAGYRNCKDKVVLTKEEYERLKGIEELLDKGYFTTENRKAIYQARKETAREIYKRLIELSEYPCNSREEIYKAVFEPFGVEVEE